MFLRLDGLTEKWETGEASDWQDDKELHNAADVNDLQCDMNGMGRGNEFSNEFSNEADIWYGYQLIRGKQFINFSVNFLSIYKENESWFSPRKKRTSF